MPTSAERLAALRAVLSDMGVDGLLLPHSDEHMSEYLAPSSERLAWLSGFDGSAGMAIVLMDKAAIFSDGRYTLQLKNQTDPTCWQTHHIAHTPPAMWLKKTLGEAGRIGYIPSITNLSFLAPFLKERLRLVALQRNPIDHIWHDRPAPPAYPITEHPLCHAGRTTREKLRDITAQLLQEGCEAAVLCDPASISWLFNIRGQDVPYTPVPLLFAILYSDGWATIFAEKSRFEPDLPKMLAAAGVSIAPPAELERALCNLRQKSVWLDPSATNLWISETLQENGTTLKYLPDPCLLPKSIKTLAEQDGARKAHLLDGVAVSRFLYWLSHSGIGKTEVELARKLSSLRCQHDLYRGDSFATISGAGPNGAIIHYHAKTEQARALGPNEVYLVDSGGQYLCGTTDITRTIWSGPDEAPDFIRDCFTRVLKGHIALASAHFPATLPAQHLDAFARYPLWQKGLDYDHGTGHGVGSYLSVHEGPCRISARDTASNTLQPGMILSNEPGFYLEGQFGIRLENLMLVQKSPVSPQSREFLSFETLTLAPFDKNLIDFGSLSNSERAWLNHYHGAVREKLAPYLAEKERAWLEHACSPV